MNLYQKVNKNVKKFNLLEQSNAESLYMKKNPKVLYVGGNNASNTLDEGRGLTPDKPFADIIMAGNWLTDNYSSRRESVIRVQGDTELLANTNNFFNAHNIAAIYISSYPVEQRYTIRSQSFIKVFSGHVIFENLKFEFDTSGLAFHINGGWRGAAPCLWLNNCEISGKANITIDAYINSFVYVRNITGEMEGRRYYCARGSVISTERKGPNAIPGTIDGYCDESSFYL